MTKPQLQQELQARGEPIDGVKWPLNTISVLATRVELLLELGFGHGGWGFQSCSHTTLLKRNGSPGSRPGSPESLRMLEHFLELWPKLRLIRNRPFLNI